MMYLQRSIMLWILLAVVVFPIHGMAEPVAKIGKWELQQEEVDRGLSAKFYELREARVQSMVLEHLLKIESAALQVDPDQLLKKQVSAKVIPPTATEITQFIAANRERLPDGGKGMEERVKGFMLEQKQEAAQEEYLRRLWQKHGVEILLQPPKFEVTGPQDLSRGKADAPITVIEFSDFECPYCRRAQATLKAVKNAYGDKVRFVFRHYPLPFHKLAPKASEGSQCAADQGKFWPFHDALFTDGAELTPAALKKLAGKLTLDQAKFDTCLDSGRHAERVAQDSAEGKRLGISGTPTFFINGVRLVGAVSLSKFKQVIDSELKSR